MSTTVRGSPVNDGWMVRHGLNAVAEEQTFGIRLKKLNLATAPDKLMLANQNQ
jgi:hypothetical protein